MRNDNTYITYPLSESDILDDYITATDVTATPTVADGETLPTLSTPCPSGEYTL